MAYNKILVDNTTCSRRFHITFDDEASKVSHTKVECLHCGVVVFERDNHPPVKLARDENLIQATQLSPYRTKPCEFRDTFSTPSQPK